ncbi:hypothetical protein EBR96_09950, partial [bacterium]|nr:hypothetical protein [bacterium]
MDFKLFWNRYKRYFLLIPAGAIIVIVAAAFTHYLGSHSIKTRIPNRPALEAAPTENNAPVQPEVVHIRPPKAVRSIYMTSWVGSNIPWRNQLVEFIKDSEINAVVIDIKDYSGLIAFDTQDPEIKKLNTEELRIRDFRAFIQQLHDANIYVIGRITVFQDPTYAKIFPSQAVQTSAGNLWADRNGLHYIDPSSQQYWDYIVRIGTAAANAGVDELNFDYIRFPTDGNMKDIVFPLSGPKFAKWATSTHSVHALTEPRSGTSNLQGSGNITQKRRPTNKERVLTEFFAYLDQHLAPLGIPISAD